MTLSPLSLYRVTGIRKVPHVPTPEERLQAFRAIQPAQFANSFDFAEAARRYAAEQAPGDDYETELAEGFAMKYGVAHDAG